MINIFHIKYEEYKDEKYLAADEINLLNQAKKAWKNAYAKYSDFKVGSAVLLDTGDIILGSNQENAAYPNGLCAERTAIFYAAANFPFAQILKLAIVGGNNENSLVPVFPCGACRQVLLEYEIRQRKSLEILCSGMQGKIIKFFNVSDLLPFSFNKKNL